MCVDMCGGVYVTVIPSVYRCVAAVVYVSVMLSVCRCVVVVCV